MGYPMTLKRFLNRNGLLDGSYDETPQRWRRTPPVTISDDSHVRALIQQWAGDVERWNGSMRLLIGDLRRLERDTLDEQAINANICRVTGIDQDTVAAVLRAYWDF